MNMQTADGYAKDRFFVRLPLSAPFMKNAKIGIYYDGTWIRFMKEGKFGCSNCYFIACDRPNVLEA